jgi:heavy metal sensor kinase
MKLPRSIRWRLLLWYGLLLGSLLTGLAMTAYHYVHEQLYDHVDEELTTRFRLVEQFRRETQNRNSDEINVIQRELGLVYIDFEVLEDGPRGNDTPGPPHQALPAGEEGMAELEELFGDGSKPPPRRPRRQGGDPPDWEEFRENFGPLGRYYFFVWTNNPRTQWCSAQAPQDLPRPDQQVQTIRQRGQFREASRVPAPSDMILVGRSTAHEEEECRRAGFALAGGGFMLFILSMGVGWVLVSQSLRPIRAITATAHRIAGGDLTQRIDLRETESELGALAGVLNGTFARLDAAFAQQARFTADAAHELRTPVTVILTHAQNGLAAEGGTEEHQEAFEACQRAAQRMRRLIESLLQLSRMDAGQELLAAEPCDLAEMAAECAAHLRPLAEQAGLRLKLDLHPAPTRGDYDRLAQVTTNLLNNALSYNKPGGEIRVTTGSREGRAFLEVADTGQGISPEHLPHIFERFFRVDKARTTHIGKSGLGLAISQAIAEAHQGKLTATSTLGQGSVFTLSLPEDSDGAAVYKPPGV